MLPYFVRCEHDRDFAGPAHGADGPVPVRRLPRERWPAPLAAFGEACRARGYPECPDHNDPDSTGFGATPRNELDGVRASTMLTHLAPARGRPNLELRADTQVVRVLFEAGRAVGVETAAGERVAADEVVLCAGAIMSPHILFHSGIGPRDALAAAGIECVHELPVGRSLRDHSMAPLVAFEPPGGDWWECGFSAMLKWDSTIRGRRNDLVLLGAVVRTTSLNFETPPGVETVFTFGAVVGRPYSTGWLAPRSADPLQPPEIHIGFLSDPRDRTLLGEAMGVALKLVETPPLRDVLGEVVVPPPAGRADLDRWLLENVTTGFHAVGTCRLGEVVDRELRVRGIEDLYVADASIMPDITTALTSATCVMIGERFADLLARRAPAGAAAASAG